jgi:VanZ family protein
MTEGTWKSCFWPWRVLLCVLVTGGVLGLTHIPGPSIPPVLQHVTSDKIEHIVAYGLIAGSFLLSLKRPVRPALLLLGLAALALLGALDETTQPLVNRTADIRDYFSDLIGVAASSLVFLIATRSLRKDKTVTRP